MPPPPRASTPPQDEQTVDDDLRRKREQRLKRDAPVDPEGRAQRARRDALYEEATTPRHRQAYFDVSLLLVSTNYRGQREAFRDNPTSHFNFLWRHGGKDMDGKRGMFSGFRLAPFSGTAKVSGVPGNFGLTYFGPAIGWGKFDAVPQDYGQVATDPSKPDGLPGIPVVSGWVVTMGVAAQSRTSSTDNVEGKEIEDDLVSKGVDFDRPGIWLEGRIIRIHYGATGYSAVFGVQTGEEKAFFYAGLAAIALY